MYLTHRCYQSVTSFILRFEDLFILKLIDIKCIKRGKQFYL